jgi:pimeloyl-ACP methyl ester carboxylesterase
LHGYPQTHFIWHKVADRLSEQYTVVLTDLRGYGDSGKIQNAPLPEHMTGADPEFFLSQHFAGKETEL